MVEITSFTSIDTRSMLIWNDGYIYADDAITVSESEAETVYSGDFSEDTNGMASGTVTGISWFLSGVPQYEITGMSSDLVWLVDQITSGDAASAIASIFSGDDTYLGGSEGDFVRTYDGDDSLTGGVGDDTLLGEGGADTIDGGDGNDIIWGGSNVGLEKDILNGGAGDDTVYGNGGYDSIEGGTGNDLLYGYANADNIYGGEGNDSLWGGHGLDRLFGGSGNDKLMGEDDNDGLFGGDGSDSLYGGEGDDRLYGGFQNDLLLGDHGNDALYGGAGMDALDGGEGDDLLEGNAGSDAFIFTGQGHDTITDFDAFDPREQIDLRYYGGGQYPSWVLIDMEQVGSDVVINLPGDASITLLDVDMNNLDGTDFLLGYC